MPLMGIRAYAAHRGCSHVAVLKAIKAGRIHTVGEGSDRKIDSDQADRAWTANTDPARQSVLHSAGPPLPPSTSGPDPDDDTPTGGDADTAAYRAERAKREAIRREREQLALEQERKRLVDKDEVARLRFTEFRALRDALGNVGARIKDACAAELDPLRCEALIDAEINACLSGFADQVLTRGVLQDADDEEDEDP